MKNEYAMDPGQPSGHLDLRLAHSDPDYSRIQFLPAPPGLAVQEAATPEGQHYFIAPRDADIAFAFSIGAVNFAGLLCVRGFFGRDSYLDGAFGGLVEGLYHLERENVEAQADGIGIRAHILIDFDRRHAVAWVDSVGTRCCGYRNWGKCDVWYTSDQVIIASW